MDWSTFALLGGLSVFVGALIGGIGIGGVFLVPILTYIFDVEVHMAIAAAMFSYLFSGLIGTSIYVRKRSINWNMALWLFAGAMPAAFMGALLASAVPARGLEFLIAALIVFAGGNALLTKVDEANQVRLLGPVQLVVIGVVTGIGSALSGTGGPLVLVPVLVWLKVPTLTVVGLSQAVQLPIVGIGGITCANDALEFLIAGADAVAVGTSSFTDPSTVIRVVEGIESFLKQNQLCSVRDIVGTLQT